MEQGLRDLDFFDSLYCILENHWSEKFENSEYKL
jgi:hypothetical protein